LARRKKGRPKKSSSAAIPPAKHTSITQLVRELIEQEMYTATGHARKRLDEREISMKEVRTALKSGRRVSAYDEFHTHDNNGNEVNRWSYAFEKSGLDRQIRVCVSIDESKNKHLLIVTVIDLD